MQEVGDDDDVEGFRGRGLGDDVPALGLQGQAGGGPGEAGDGTLGVVPGPSLQTVPGEEEGVAATAAGEIEGAPAGGEFLGMGDEEGESFRCRRRGLGVTGFPMGVAVVSHGVRPVGSYPLSRSWRVSRRVAAVGRSYGWCSPQRSLRMRGSSSLRLQGL